jgi:hypothetical protein
MTAIGLLLGAFERTFGSGLSSVLFLAIGLALLQGLVAVESRLPQYVGDLIQRAGLSFIVSCRSSSGRASAPQRREIGCSPPIGNPDREPGDRARRVLVARWRGDRRYPGPPAARRGGLSALHVPGVKTS